MNDFYDEDMELRDYLALVSRRRTLILSVAGLFLLTSIIVSFSLPKTYESTASLLPPQQENSLGGAMLNQLQGSVGSLASSILDVGTVSDVWMGMIKSQTILDSIIDRFNLRSVYGANSLDDARSTLSKKVSISKSKEGIILLTVEDRDPGRAADLANAFVEELDSLNKELVMSSGKRTRVFIERRLDEVRADLHDAEMQLKDFQTKNGVIKLDEQANALIDTLGAVKADLIRSEVELNTRLSYATPSNPSVVILKSHVEQLKDRLRALEKGEAGEGDSGVFIPTERIPDLAQQYAGILRNAKRQEILYEILVQQYEMAKIMEAKDTQTVQVLDVAKKPENSSGPKIKMIILLTTAFGVFIGVLAAVAMETYRPGEGKA